MSAVFKSRVHFIPMATEGDAHSPPTIAALMAMNGFTAQEVQIMSNGISTQDIVAQAQRVLVAQDAKIRELQPQVSDLQRQVAQARTEASGAMQERDAVAQKAAALLEQLAAAQKTIADLRAKNDDDEKAVSKLASLLGMKGSSNGSADAAPVPGQSGSNGSTKSSRTAAGQADVAEVEMSAV